MTFILGARCRDGAVLVADRMVSSKDGTIRELGDKLLYDIEFTVYGAAGYLDYSESFKERIRAALRDRKIPANQFILLVEDVHSALLKNYGTNVVGNFAVLIASRFGPKSAINFVGGWGGHHPVEKYEAIGSGQPYGEIFLKKLWKPSMGMMEAAELGYFIIKVIENYKLDAAVGLEYGHDIRHPQVGFLPDNPQPPGSSFGSDLKIRRATESELSSMKENVERKLRTFESGFEDFLNRS